MCYDAFVLCDAIDVKSSNGAARMLHIGMAVELFHTHFNISKHKVL